MTQALGGGLPAPKDHGYAAQAVHQVGDEKVLELHRVRRAPDARSPLGRADAAAVLRLALGLPAVALAGASGALAAASVAAIATGLRPGAGPARFRRSLAAVGDWSDADIERRLHRHVAQKNREAALLPLELLGRSRPSFDITGLDCLRDALGRGRGAVLWVADTWCASILVKRALHGVGLPLRQVSTPAHGLSRSRFGRAFLNPLSAAVENRYLRERILFDVGGEATLLRRVKRALAAGDLVGMTMNTYAGSAFYETGFGHRGRLLMATAAPKLAVNEGVPLFTATLTEVDPMRCYRLSIGRDCASVQGLPSGAKSARAAASAKAALRARDEFLEAFLLAPEAFALPSQVDMEASPGGGP